jgi:nitroreductase
LSPPEGRALDEAALDRLFRDARTRNAWRDETMAQDAMREIYDLLKMGPTSANTSPARFVWVSTEAGKARLAPHLSEGNRAKTLGAPVCVIIGYDMDFAAKIPQLFPHNPGAVDWFLDPEVAFNTAYRNSTLQGGYLIMAARALGYDAGPMSGFDAKGVEAEFFAGTNIRANFLCSIGHGTDEPFPRSPRLSFDEACQVV